MAHLPKVTAMSEKALKYLLSQGPPNQRKERQFRQRMPSKISSKNTTEGYRRQGMATTTSKATVTKKTVTPAKSAKTEPAPEPPALEAGFHRATSRT